VSRHQKGKTNLDFTEARGSEWQWHQLGHMQVCTLLQADNHASTPPVHHLVFLHAGCPSWHPTSSVKALKAQSKQYIHIAKIKKKRIKGALHPGAHTGMPVYVNRGRSGALQQPTFGLVVHAK